MDKSKRVNIHDHLFHGKPTRRERAAYKLGWRYGRLAGANKVRAEIRNALEHESS